MTTEGTTLSVIKADVGGFVGHSSMHEALLEEAKECLGDAEQRGLLIDFHVTRCGDDLELIMSHRRGVANTEIHGLAWSTFEECTAVAEGLNLYSSGQDLIRAPSPGGLIRGAGPGVAEMELVERKGETVIVLMADKTSAGAWNLPLYKMFADPFNTAGLVIAPGMHEGFWFEVHDVKEHKKIVFETPEDIYDLLLFIGAPGRYLIKAVYCKVGKEIAAVSSTERLSLIAGRNVGKDDPVCIVRCQEQFPAVGEVLEPFSWPYLVQGFMRGSHWGPLMPVAVRESNPTRFDGPPRAVALGFQLSNGRLIGPRDMFDDPSFDEARHMCNTVADYLRRHGPFEPHRLPLGEMEYTTLPLVMEGLKGRWEDL